MKSTYKKLYDEILSGIERCLNLELPEKEKVEDCFWIVNNHVEKLKQLVKEKPFGDENDEIEFFRNVKPQFTSWMEYFIILSEALIAVPGEGTRVIHYWEAETERFKRFCDKNNAFVQYYKSGKRYLDSNYFLRSNNDLHNITKTRVYDVEADLYTAHDHLVRGYLAQKKYKKYVKQRLEEL